MSPLLFISYDKAKDGSETRIAGVSPSPGVCVVQLVRRYDRAGNLVSFTGSAPRPVPVKFVRRGLTLRPRHG